MKQLIPNEEAEKAAKSITSAFSTDKEGKELLMDCAMLGIEAANKKFNEDVKPVLEKALQSLEISKAELKSTGFKAYPSIVDDAISEIKNLL